MTQILMPALSPTMEEGKLAKWHVKEGDAVKAGDILAEIETDKATMEFEAIDAGRIAKLLVAEGAEGVKVNAPIAELAQEGEEATAPQTKQAFPSPLEGEGAPKAPVKRKHRSLRRPSEARTRASTLPQGEVLRIAAAIAGNPSRCGTRHHDGARCLARCHGRGDAAR